jgi:8-oxo-dGTP diphosphatase
MKQIEVVAAILLRDKRILCVQRGENKLPYISRKYEFPGGKTEPGESREEAVKRELMEELRMKIEVLEAYMTVTHQYPDFHLTMHTFICTSQTPTVTLTEHIDYQWLTSDQLSGLDWAEADLPIIEKLMVEVEYGLL